MPTPVKAVSIILLLVASMAKAAEKPALLFETAIPLTSPRAQKNLQLMQGIMEPLGFKLTSEFFPSKRGLQLLKSGRVDGTLGRADGTNLMVDLMHLVKVDVPIAHFQISMWCRKDPQNLLRESTRLRVGIRSGTPISESIVEQFAVEKSISYVNAPMQAMSMLSSNRLDCYLDSENVIASFDPKLPEKFQALGYRFNYVDWLIFVYVQPKWKHLVPQMEKLMRQAPEEPFSFRNRKAKSSASNGSIAVAADGIFVLRPLLLKAELFQ